MAGLATDYRTAALAVIAVAAAVAAAVAVRADTNPLQLGSGVTLVVEVAVGIVIAIIVYGRSRRNDRNVEDAVSQIGRIVQEREAARKDQSDVIMNILTGALDAISKAAAEAGSPPPRAAPRGAASGSGGTRPVPIRDIKEKSVIFNELRAVLINFIPPETVHDMLKIGRLCDGLGGGHGERDADIQMCASIKRAADALLQKLDMAAQAEEGGPEPAAPGDGEGLSIAPDRTAYPIGAVVYVRTWPGASRGGEVRYTVTESGRVVDESSAAPADHPGGGGAHKGVLDHRIRLEGRRWKAGRTYDVTASLGGSSATARFSIVKRAPIIESDSDVYMAGDDMIITVIDPDADKDSREVEHVGGGGDSRLVIESDDGKIDGYRLRETGRSTGIFQGIVGILRVRSDGSTASHEFGGRRIDRTQGTGIEDGFIECRQAGNIRVRYTSPSGSATFTVFASNYSARIELDRRAYHCTGRAEVTVIAPDLVPGPGRRGTAGDDAECMLSLSTSLGRLNGYRLKETEEDAGVYQGTVTLTGFADGPGSAAGPASRGVTGGAGPDGGMLACSREDTLKARIAMGTGDAYESEAAVRWNIGEIMFLRDSYRTGDRAVVRVVDPDGVLEPGAINSLDVRISSDSDPKGIPIKARESSPGTGVFECGILVDAAASSPRDARIKASHGDTIRAEYADSTLPSPYGPGDRVDLVASARVSSIDGGPLPPVAGRARRATITVRSEKGGWRPIMDGDAALITVDAAGVSGRDPFTAIASVSDSSGAQLGILTEVLRAGPKGSASCTFRWSPPGSGVFRVTAYLWESLEVPVPLCAAVSESINVVDRSLV